MQPQKGNHSVYCLQYHLMLVVKYQKKCINDEIGEFLISETQCGKKPFLPERQNVIHPRLSNS